MKRYFNEENVSLDLTKSELNAERILTRINTHDYDSGGIFSECTGSQGSGKTSVLLSFVDYALKHYPDEKVFFNECFHAPLQCTKLGLDKINLMVEDNSDIIFCDRSQKLKEIFPPVIYFKDFEDCYEKSIPGKCNVVFFKERMMLIDFIGWLRGVGVWNHVFIDEMSEIGPAFSGGRTWKKIKDFSLILKDVRKCMINIHCNSQSVVDTDHRVRSKIMCKIYLPGAKSDRDSRITQRAIDNLSEDKEHGSEAFLEYSGKFGKTKFCDIYKPLPGVHWEARIR